MIRIMSSLPVSARASLRFPMRNAIVTRASRGLDLGMAAAGAAAAMAGHAPQYFRGFDLEDTAAIGRLAAGVRKGVRPHVRAGQ